jgi:hypothetical protein
MGKMPREAGMNLIRLRGDILGRVRATNAANGRKEPAQLSVRVLQKVPGTQPKSRSQWPTTTSLSPCTLLLAFVFNLQVKNSAEYALSSWSPKLARFRLRLRQRLRLHHRALVT